MFYAAGLVGPWVIFSLIWSVGATCDTTSREKFSQWIREATKDDERTTQFPEEGLVYDYR